MNLNKRTLIRHFSVWSVSCRPRFVAPLLRALLVNPQSVGYGWPNIWSKITHLAGVTRSYSALNHRQGPFERLGPFHGPQVTLTPCLAIGSERNRFPVAGKRALATAGAMGGVLGSPMPPGCSAPSMIDTAIFGICARCSIG